MDLSSPRRLVRSPLLRSVGLATGIAAALASAGSLAHGQTVIDNFNDADPAPMWFDYDFTGDAIASNQTGGRVEFPIAPNSTGFPYAQFRGNNWGISTQTEARFRLSFRFASPIPPSDYAAFRVNFSPIGTKAAANGLFSGILLSVGSKVQPSPQRLVTVDRILSGGAISNQLSFWGQLASSVFFWPNSQQVAFGLTDTGTLYCRYVPGIDTLLLSFTGYNDPAAFGLTGATFGQFRPMQLCLGAIANGSTTQLGADLWVDDVVLDQGTLVWSKTPWVLWRQPNTGAIALWEVAPSGLVATPGTFAPVAPGSGWVPYGIGDFNADGNVDIFWRNTITGTNYIWYLAGVNLIGGAVPPGVPPGSGWTPRVCGDFNRDGYADVVWKNSNTGEYQMWLLKGAVIIGGGSLGVPGAAWTLAAAGDMNKDGTDDLIWRAPGNGQNFVWCMNGVSIISSIALPALPPASGWTLVGAIDVDRSGQDDLLWRNAAGQNTLWIMNGPNVQTTLSISAVAQPWGVFGTQ